MHAIIIQPGDPKAPIKARSNFSSGLTSLSPSTDLMALDAHIRERSRHGSKFIDTRILDNGYADLVDEIQQMPAPQVVVVGASTQGLGQTTAIVELVKKHYPEIPVGICGQYPSDFPVEAAAFPNIDFALSGDPEPILKHYLDYFDTPQRLAKIAGLQLPGQDVKPSAFSRNLAAEVALPDLAHAYWGAYRRDISNPFCLAELRLSRGNTGLPPDHAFPAHEEAVRFFDLKALATLMDRCTGSSITHVRLIDPPGIWTLNRLVDWCNALKTTRNTQAWGLQFLPTLLQGAEIKLMMDAWCRRIDFVFPSCDPDLLRQSGCIVDPTSFKHLLRALKDSGISVTLHFWIGGPEEAPGEVQRVANMIKKIGYVAYQLHPYPYHFNSQVYAEHGNDQAGPNVQDFIDWARDPWNLDRPVPIWNGESGASKTESMAKAIQRKVNHNPMRVMAKILDRVVNTKWIDKIERKAIGIDALLAQEQEEFTMGRNRPE
ncbi:MAG: hypothetical protein ACI9TH_002987 [Kiritimatiellia bacterium]